MIRSGHGRSLDCLVAEPMKRADPRESTAAGALDARWGPTTSMQIDCLSSKLSGQIHH